MIKKVTGTQDIYNDKERCFTYIENMFAKTCHTYGYSRFRTPILEKEELFNRAISESDIVQKELYTLTKGREKLVLRPEGTAPLARAVIENKLYQGNKNIKAYYIEPMFRGEKKQRGRYRQFTQVGIEQVGDLTYADVAEAIVLNIRTLESMNLTADINFSLRINYLGCPGCTENYTEQLKEFFTNNADKLAEEDQQRLLKGSILRILDTKEQQTRELFASAPRLSESLCEDCLTRYDSIKEFLSDVTITFTEDDGLVRGLDYYTGFVYEIIAEGLAIAGGGEYGEKLFSEISQATETLLKNGFGFAMSLERLSDFVSDLMPEQDDDSYFVIAIGDSARTKLPYFVDKLRKRYNNVTTSYNQQSVKKLFRTADRDNCKFAFVIGDEELENRQIKLRDLEQGTETLIELKELGIEL